jgi:hypothetical protein
MKKLLFQIGFLFVTSGATYAQELGISNINATGKLKVNGNAGTGGQVLASNSTNPPVSTSISSNTAGGKFLIKQGTVSPTTNQANNFFVIGPNAPATQTAFIDFISQDYNTSSDVTIDLANDLITINRTGIYHFEGMVGYLTNFSSIPQSPPIASLGVKIGNNSVLLIDETPLQNGIGSAFANTISFKLDKYLVANQTIKFEVGISGSNFKSNLVLIAILNGYSIKGQFMRD